MRSGGTVDVAAPRQRMARGEDIEETRSRGVIGGRFGRRRRRAAAVQTTCCLLRTRVKPLEQIRSHEPVIARCVGCVDDTERDCVWLSVREQAGERGQINVERT